MNSNWQPFLAAAGAAVASEQNEIADFGDAAGELLAAQTATVLVPLTHLGLIECAGDDARSFLHSQLTSDVNHLSDNAAQHSAWCTAKGRMTASFLIWKEGDAYRLAMAAELVEPVLKRLQMFVLRSRVSLRDLSASHLLLGLAGAQAGDALAAANLPMPAETLGSIGAGACRIVRLDSERFAISAGGDAASIWQNLASVARPAGTAAWRWLDVRAGLPWVTAATREEFVPQMADFEKIGGVSFHKGCYPGQEIVARTQYLGKVKRHLYRLRSAAPLAAGDELHSPGNPDQACGKVVTAAPSPGGGYEALAVVQANFADDVRIGGQDGPQVEAFAVNP